MIARQILGVSCNSKMGFWKYQRSQFNKFNIVFFINKMIVCPNLPFDQDYFSNPQNLQNLRTNINTLIFNDIESLQSLLSVVQKTFRHPEAFVQDSAHSQTYKKQKELELFKDRSDTVTGLAQFIIKMVDFIEDQQQKNQALIFGYQRRIDQLTDTINEMAYSKSLVENDLQILRQQLQCAQIEIDKLIEERNYFSQNQLVNSELKEELHNFKIELLENQLNKLKSTLSLFNQQQISSKKSLNFHQQPKLLKHAYSLDHFALHDFHNAGTEVDKKLVHLDDDALEKPRKMTKKQANFPQKQGKNMSRNRSPKKIFKFLTEHEISEEHIDESQLQNQPQKQIDCKKDSFCEVNQLQINSNEQQSDKFHRLCSDLSHKSFLYQILPEIEQSPPTKLIYISEDQNQNRSGTSHQNCEFDFSNITPSLETKESEISIKDTPKTKISGIGFQNQSKGGSSLMWKSTIVERKMPKMMASSVIRPTIKQQPQQPKGFYQMMSNFIVKNRVKRTTQKANSGLNKFLI